MFKPLVLIGRSVHQLEGIDNEAINEAVLKRRNIKLDESEGNTFNEDSFFPAEKVAECGKLIEEINKVIAEHVNPYFMTANSWAHILAPGESTMYHSHENKALPPGISWVYYTSVPKNSGNIVWVLDAARRKVLQEEQPKPGMLILFPDYIAHFTKKNNSSSDRVSISGNAYPPKESYEAVAKNPLNLYNYIGVFND